MIYNVSAATPALCTSNVKVLKRERMNGNSIYRTEPVHLKNENTDKVFQRSGRKIGEKKRLKRYDVLSPLSTPLMSDIMEISKRICRGMDILENPGPDMKEGDVKRMQSVLYALAVKFLDQNQLADAEKRIEMTILGQMPFEDGEKRGMERGEKQGIQR